MATGIEMLVTTLVKALKLEPEVEKIRATIKQASDEDLLSQAKDAIAKVNSFDERLARIEQLLEPGSSSAIGNSGIGLHSSNTAQLATGTNNF